MNGEETPHATAVLEAIQAGESAEMTGRQQSTSAQNAAQAWLRTRARSFAAEIRDIYYALNGGRSPVLFDDIIRNIKEGLKP